MPPNLSGYMGQKTGIPFPVMSRISFGVGGAQIPALIRGAVAIAWFGIQTYLASHVLNVLLITLHHPLVGLTENSFLGLSTLGWISFGFLWCVQIGSIPPRADLRPCRVRVAGPRVTSRPPPAPRTPRSARTGSPAAAR